MMKSCRIKKIIFKNWSRIKTVWKKTRVLKFIWKLKSRKLNFKIGILKLNLKEIGVSKILWKLEN